VNSYVSVDLLKSSSVLNVTGTGDDTRLRLLAESQSRLIDRLTNRHFYSLTAARTFDAVNGYFLNVSDLASITSLKTDENVDRTFEVTWATTDYLLRPNNADPTTRGNSNSRPYTQIIVDSNGSRSSFPLGFQTIEVTGEWGYWLHKATATETADAIASTTAKTFSLSARTDVEAGHTILIDTEQLYVQSYSGNTVTVARGVNGTTAATHSSGAAVSIYEYPEPVVEATIIQVGRMWKRKDSSYANAIGLEGGLLEIFRGIDQDVKQAVRPYRKIAIGVA
jgi:hypothetical protein